MLIRTAALVLVLANGGYYAWSQGLLAPIGLAPGSAREPQRLEQQIRPEALRVAPVASAPAEPAEPATVAAAPAVSAAPAASATTDLTACFQAGPFDTAQAEALRQALAAAGVPAGSWTLQGSSLPNRWIVYMGRYTEPGLLDKKRAELRALRVDTAPITQPGLAPGLSLGVFSSQESAQEHLAQLAQRGVRTARVVAEQRESGPAQLRLPAADTGLRERVQALGPALAGRVLAPC